MDPDVSKSVLFWLLIGAGVVLIGASCALVWCWRRNQSLEAQALLHAYNDPQTSITGHSGVGSADGLLISGFSRRTTDNFLTTDASIVEIVTRCLNKNKSPCINRLVAEPQLRQLSSSTVFVIQPDWASWKFGQTLAYLAVTTTPPVQPTFPQCIWIGEVKTISNFPKTTSQLKLTVCSTAAIGLPRALPSAWFNDSGVLWETFRAFALNLQTLFNDSGCCYDGLDPQAMDLVGFLPQTRTLQLMIPALIRTRQREDSIAGIVLRVARVLLAWLDTDPDCSCARQLLLPALRLQQCSVARRADATVTVDTLFDLAVTVGEYPVPGAVQNLVLILRDLGNDAQRAGESETAVYYWARGYCRYLLAEAINLEHHDGPSITFTDHHANGASRLTFAQPIGSGQLGLMSAAATSIFHASLARVGGHDDDTDKMLAGQCWRYAAACSAAMLRGMSNSPPTGNGSSLQSTPRLLSSWGRAMEFERKIQDKLQEFRQVNGGNNELFLPTGECSFDQLIVPRHRKRMEEFLLCLNAETSTLRVTSMERLILRDSGSLMRGDMIVLVSPLTRTSNIAHLVSFIQHIEAAGTERERLLVFDSACSDDGKALRSSLLRTCTTMARKASVITEAEAALQMALLASDANPGMINYDVQSESRLVMHPVANLNFASGVIVYRLQVARV